MQLVDCIFETPVLALPFSCGCQSCGVVLLGLNNCFTFTGSVVNYFPIILLIVRSL